MSDKNEAAVGLGGEGVQLLRVVLRGAYNFSECL